MNFRVVENAEKFQDINFTEFAETYNSHTLYNYEIMKKYGWNDKQYYDVRKEAEKRGLISKERYWCKKSKAKWYYYHKRFDLWCIIRTINGEKIYYGGYKTEEQALQIIKELEKVNWDKSKLREIQRRVKCTE